MKKALRILLQLIIVFFMAVVGFYFWGSATTLSKEKHKLLLVDSTYVHSLKDSVFSIVTYNIGYLSGMTNNQEVVKDVDHKAMFKNNLLKTLEGIKKTTPDIIAFQEIDYNADRSYNVNQEEAITALGYGYVARGVNWDKRYVPFPYWSFESHFGKVVSGQSIVSKYPITMYDCMELQRVENTPFYIDRFYIDRLLQVVKLQINQRELVVMNVHLEAFDIPTRVAQFHKVVSLFKEYKAKYPTILVGDFNSEARKEEAIIHELITMDEVGNVLFDVKAPENTYSSENPHKRIDYIFYTKESIDCIGGEVLKDFGTISDHLPLAMQFKFK